ncbi:MAG: hypothetical protein ACOX45_09730 [Acutalibacteraceae bacterium]
MNGKERMTKMLKHEAIDRIPVYERFWSDTLTSWQGKGHIDSESLDNHFDFDVRECRAFNLTADLDFKLKTVGEDSDTITYISRRQRRYLAAPQAPRCHTGTYLL